MIVRIGLLLGWCGCFSAHSLSTEDQPDAGFDQKDVVEFVDPPQPDASSESFPGFCHVGNEAIQVRLETIVGRCAFNFFEGMFIEEVAEVPEENGIRFRVDTYLRDFPRRCDIVVSGVGSEVLRTLSARLQTGPIEIEGDERTLSLREPLGDIFFAADGPVDQTDELPPLIRPLGYEFATKDESCVDEGGCRFTDWSFEVTHRSASLGEEETLVFREGQERRFSAEPVLLRNIRSSHFGCEGLRRENVWAMWSVRPFCGGRGGDVCESGSYCNIPEGCGFDDGGGVCEPVPEECSFEHQPVCGCDGRSYHNPCRAAQAGISIASEGKCVNAGALCGGRGNDYSCAPFEYCHHGEGNACGRIGGGECRSSTAENDCPLVEEVERVCGCDGLVYENECFAHAAGTDIRNQGLCEE